MAQVETAEIKDLIAVEAIKLPMALVAYLHQATDQPVLRIRLKVHLLRTIFSICVHIHATSQYSST